MTGLRLWLSLEFMKIGIMLIPLEGMRMIFRAHLLEAARATQEALYSE